jgi:hypothetical protein
VPGVLDTMHYNASLVYGHSVAVMGLHCKDHVYHALQIGMTVNFAYIIMKDVIGMMLSPACRT